MAPISRFRAFRVHMILSIVAAVTALALLTSPYVVIYVYLCGDDAGGGAAQREQSPIHPPPRGQRAVRVRPHAAPTHPSCTHTYFPLRNEITLYPLTCFMYIANEGSVAPGLLWGPADPSCSARGARTAAHPPARDPGVLLLRGDM
eukprot:1510253-Pyramimonas_sp.AAC.1